MQTLIRNTFDKQQNTCVALVITQSVSSPAVGFAAAAPLLGSKSLPRRSQLCRARRGWYGTLSFDRVVVVVQDPSKRLLMMASGSSSLSSAALIGYLSLVLLLLLQFVFAVVAVVEIEGLTPEDVRFATLRCQNESTHDASMRLQWSLRMFPDNRETHCYVKCLLSKLGLINLKNRGLDGNKFIQPLENQDIDISEECYSHLEDTLSGTCESYYRKWMDLRTNCKEFFYISLFEDPREVEKFNNLNTTQSKKLGETATEFCGKCLACSESRELTSEQTLGDDILTIFKCELSCIFRHFRYFDLYGRVDENEILRSFKEANSNTQGNIQVVSICVHRSNALYPFGPCQMAYELYQCLITKIKNFKEIYSQRDKISRYF